MKSEADLAEVGVVSDWSVYQQQPSVLGQYPSSRNWTTTAVVYPGSYSGGDNGVSDLTSAPTMAVGKPLRSWSRTRGRSAKTHQYDAATLIKCIEHVKDYKMSQREAEKVFDIPRTTIQTKLAQMYPNWVAPSRRMFTKARRNRYRIPFIQRQAMETSEAPGTRYDSRTCDIHN